MQHVAYLWKKVRECKPPPKKFRSHGKTFKKAYDGLNLDMVPTPETRMEQLFGNMSSFYGDAPFVDEVEEDWEVDTAPPAKKIEMNDGDPHKISEKSGRYVIPKVIMKPSSSTFGSAHAQQKVTVVPVKAPYRERDDDQSIKPRSKVTVAPVNAPYRDGTKDKSNKPRNYEAASTSKPRPRSDFVHKPLKNPVAKPPLKTRDEDMSKSRPSIQEIRQPSKKKKNPPETMGTDFLLFLTNPSEYIRLNPSLFPSSDATWSAKKLLPDQPTKRKKPNPVNDPVPEPEVTQTLADCTETLLRVDFTPEEYVDLTTAPNYYAQGVKIVDGVRRVVFYHKMIDLSAIKKEPV
ncbi:muscle M-line assembly protein unc-89-like [Folsomia candida]|nr:muscle M-line assembly protein unc-89-like [Folsomia candida]